jgi:hypothetical protein
MEKGDYKNDIGNKSARREKMTYGGMMKKKKMMGGGRVKYKDGGSMKMDGCQPVYNGIPKAKAN